MGERGYVKAESALVQAADDLLRRHSSTPSGMCVSCGQVCPCPSARNALDVRRAAGLPDEVPPAPAYPADPLSTSSLEPVGVGVGGGPDPIGYGTGGGYGAGPAFGTGGGGMLPTPMPQVAVALSKD